MKALYEILGIICSFFVDVCITGPLQLTMRFINFLLYKQNQNHDNNNRNPSN